MSIHNRGYWLDKAETDTHASDPVLKEALVKVFSDVKTIIDIGCGNGEYTKHFIQHKFECSGYDGCPITPEITNGVCKVQDFSVPVSLGTFDLVLSLEVGEHVPQQYEQIFIDNLTSHSTKYICISWGVVGQPGIGHVNCRNNDYIIEEMSKRDFEFDKSKSNILRKYSTFPWFENTVMVFYKVQRKSALSIFAGYEKSLVSVVLTACGRLELLMRTIESFNKYNTFPINQFIIVDDSGDKKVHKELKKSYPDCTLVLNDKNIGLIDSIDRGYSKVQTPYIMHLEEDWEFYRPGFIEKSLEILLCESAIMMVWVRALNDTNGHPIEPKIYKANDVNYQLVACGVQGMWHGFTWNPGLRRLSDYQKVGKYGKIAPWEKAGMRECLVGIEYFRLGFRSAILPEGYVYHTGGGYKSWSLA